MSISVSRGRVEAVGWVFAWNLSAHCDMRTENWRVHCNVSIDGLVEGRSCAAATQSDQHELLTFQITHRDERRESDWRRDWVEIKIRKLNAGIPSVCVDEWSNYQFTRLFIALQLSCASLILLSYSSQLVQWSRLGNFNLQSNFFHFLFPPCLWWPSIIHNIFAINYRHTPNGEWKLDTSLTLHCCLIAGCYWVFYWLDSSHDWELLMNEEIIYYMTQSVEDDNDDENCIQGNCTILQMSLMLESCWIDIHSDRLCKCPV